MKVILDQTYDKYIAECEICNKPSLPTYCYKDRDDDYLGDYFHMHVCSEICLNVAILQHNQ